MLFEEFEQQWPAGNEGESFRNKDGLQFLEVRRKALPTGRWLWFGLPISWAISKFLGGSLLEWAVAAGCLGLFEIVDLLIRIMAQNHETRVEIEYLKGAIRENRWLSVRNHEIFVKTGNRDVDGSRIF